MTRRRRIGTVDPVAEPGGRLTIRAADDGLVLEGEIDGSSVSDFDRALADRVAAGGFVRLDMAGVTSIDAHGLRVLVAATGRSRSADANVVLDAPRAEVARFVEESGLAWLLSMINVEPRAAVATSPSG